jgi:signal transduction histidine kinase
MESGNRQLVLEPFEPAAVLRDVAEMMRVAADKKAITLDARWHGLGGLRVTGDARAFRQIVTNLLGNAVKFTDHGGVSLSATATSDGERAGLVIAVEDTGRGIPAEALPQVFERFFQVDGSLSRNTEGTGLGLAISQSLAKMMGGQIEVASRVGLGSIFTFTVGFDLAETSAEARDAA